MKIPYGVTALIKDAFGWHDRLYQSLFDILVMANGLGLLLAVPADIEEPDRPLYLPEMEGVFLPLQKATKDKQRRSARESVSTEKAYFVFDHIIRRTIPFYKPLEFVTVKQIMQGLPQLAIAGCGLSESTIRRTLSVCSHFDYLIKLKYRPGVVQTRIIGLNIPLLLRILDAVWEHALIEHQYRKDNLTVDDMIDGPGTNCRIADKAKFLLKPCIKYCDRFARAFDFMSSYTDPICDIYEFLGELKEYFPDRSGLNNEFMNECEKIDKKVKRRYKKRAEKRAN